MVSITNGGTFYWLNPSSGPNTLRDAMPFNVSLTAPMNVGGPKVVPHGFIVTPRLESTAFTVQNLALLLASSRKGHLPQWKLAQHNGDPLQRHEWFDQFNSSLDSYPLTDDVKMTYFKTLVTGEAKSVMAEFTYCRIMYKVALTTVERKFEQPEVAVSAYLYKLNIFRPLKMHKSESLIR